jgi:hypothetical protein
LFQGYTGDEPVRSRTVYRRSATVTYLFILSSIASIECCSAQTFRAEISVAKTVVKNNEGFPVVIGVRNIGSVDQSLLVWDCSYPAQWLPDNSALHVDVACLQNSREEIKLKPGQTYRRTVSFYVRLAGDGANRKEVTFRLGYGPDAYFGTHESTSQKVPLFWSNAVTVVVASGPPK